MSEDSAKTKEKPMMEETEDQKMLDAIAGDVERAFGDGDCTVQEVASFIRWWNQGNRMDGESEDRLINLRIPLGTWGINGMWHANPHMQMSAEDQRRSNIENGFCQS